MQSASPLQNKTTMNSTNIIRRLSKLVFASLLVLFFLGTLSADEKTTTIFVIGDSTAAQKSHPESNPERGWGMVLQGYFDGGIKVDNHAVNGRSSLSFRNEGRWDKVLERIKPGDYVIIQFGHNDEKPRADRHTDPGTTFDANLERYCRETREKGGIPILMSCVVRRNFYTKPDSTVDDESLRTVTYGDEEVNSDTLIDTHGAYKDSPRHVAQRLGVVFIDANRITHDLEQSMGIEGSRSLHMWFKPGEVASIPDGRKDNTHYNTQGAHIVAGLLADALCKEVKVLKKHLVHYDYIVSGRGSGNYMNIADAIAAMPATGKQKVYVLDGTWTVKKSDLGGRRVKFECYPGAKVEIMKD